MTKKKLKIEMSDECDNKVTITFEGKLDERSIQSLVSSVNKVMNKGNNSVEEEISDIPIEEALDLPLYEKVKLLISTAYGMGPWFTTNELCESFKDVFSTTVKTTTASTYLARLFEEGFLERRGSRNERKYKLRKELREKVPKLLTQ